MGCREGVSGGVRRSEGEGVGNEGRCCGMWPHTLLECRPEGGYSRGYSHFTNGYLLGQKPDKKLCKDKVM